MTIDNVKEAFAQEFATREARGTSQRYSRGLKLAVADLVASGVSANAASKELGISLSAVTKWARRHIKRSKEFVPLKIESSTPMPAHKANAPASARMVVTTPSGIRIECFW